MGRYVDDLNANNKSGWKKKFVRYDTGADLFDMSQKTFERLVKECTETYKPCKCKPRHIVLVDVEIFEEYLELFREH